MDAPTHVRPGRNEPCFCGSGKKYKQCCLAKDEAIAASARATAAASAPVATAGESEAEVPIKRGPKHQTAQPWRNTTSRGFVPRSTTPRKAGGS
jgi:hypothetical protein